MRETEPKVEVVDIGQEADHLGSAFGAELTPLDEWDKEKEIETRWWKERVVIIVSMMVIFSLLVTGIAIIALGVEESTRDWARQLLSTLMGFAAGSIWQSQASDRR